MSMIIGSVPYLNARPLVEWFTETDEGRNSGVTVIEAVPSVLYQMLRNGEVSCALLSSVTGFKNSEWQHCPGVGIVSCGAVESVRLLSRIPIENIKTVALDTSSLTSVAMVKILLQERFGLNPEYIPHPPDLNAMLSLADAALLIGDNGFKEYDANLLSLDLGAEWTAWTNLPFVYAVWLGEAYSLTPPLVSSLQRAKEWGTQNISRIAERRAQLHGKTVESAIHYMTKAILYDLAEKEEEGLALFGEKARANGVL